MLDSETNSEWSHLLGEAMAGPLVGEVLDVIPSMITDWKTWKAEHPDTTALLMQRTADKFRNDVYGNNPNANWVLGYREEKQSRYWTFRDLVKQTVVNDQFADRQLLVLFDTTSSTALIYDRLIDGKPLTFERREDGKLFDHETGSQWHDLSGKAVSGKLAGTQLNRMPAIVSYLRPWQQFHPTSTAWTPE